MTELLQTKFFTPPAPRGVLERERLCRFMDGALTHPLILVSAPAGAGKTTLVTQWLNSLEQRQASFAWLSLDEADNDPSRFMDYFRACLEEAGASLPEGLQVDAGSETMRQEPLLEGYIRAMFDHKRGVVVVLDDYHVIEAPAIHRLVAFLIDHAPACLHLMLLTRSDPPLELARLRVAGKLLEVRMDDLRFSTQEAGDFLKESSGVMLSEEAVQSLNTRAEGWIAGLQMAAISLRDSKDPEAFIASFAGSHRYVFDYLIEQVLDRQTPEMREFMLRTSILDRFSAPLCDAVSGNGGTSRGILSAIERANLFLVPLDDERGWFRYHHLFAGLLRLALDQTYPGLTADLHKKASGWYEAQGYPVQALEHALAGEDMSLAAHIISANALLLIENDDMTPIIKKVEGIPKEKLIQFPWLGIAAAWVLGPKQGEKCQLVLDEIFTRVNTQPADNGNRRLLGHIHAAKALLGTYNNDQESIIRNAELADELLPEDELAVRAINLENWGDTRDDDRRHDPELLPILEKGMALARQAGKPHIIVIAVGTLASAYLHMGKMHAMHQICLEGLAEADAYQQKHQQLLSATANVYSLFARVLAEWGENEEAIRYAHKGLMASERWGQIDTEVICLNYLGRALVFGNECEQAKEIFKRAERQAKKISAWFSEITAVFTLDSMLDADGIDEKDITRQAEFVRTCGAQFTNLVFARLMLRKNDPDSALAMLETIDAHQAGRESFDTVRILGLRALAFQAKTDARQAQTSLRKALLLAEGENRIATFVREGAAMEKLLRQPQSRAAAPAFVSRLLAGFEYRRQKRNPTPTREPLIDPLSERETEVLQHLNSYLSTPEIADRLVLSSNTIRTHIKNIYSKLGVHGRSGAVQRAGELGLLH